jgi:uncharacterized protein YPO0396
MEPMDVAIEVLKGMRDEARATNTRLDDLRGELSGRIDQTNARLDDMREELLRRIVESETRTSAAIAELARAVRDMTDELNWRL